MIYLILGLEGLEFNRRLTIDELNEDTFGERNSMSGNGTSQVSLERKNDKQPSSTFISKKVFIYTDLRNRSEIISQFRSGKFAPQRPVAGTKIMYELITIGPKMKSGRYLNSFEVKNNIKIKGKKNIIDENKMRDSTSTTITKNHENNFSTTTKKRQNRKSNSNNNFGNYFAEIEWPGGRKTRTEKISVSRDSGGQFSLLDVLFGDFTERSELGVQYNVINFMRGKPKKPFNKWISFASPPDKISSGRSQEYYTIAKERITFTPIQYLSDVSKFMMYKMKNVENIIRMTSLNEINSEFYHKLKNILSKRKNDDSFTSIIVENDQNDIDKFDDISYQIRPIINHSVANLKYKRYGEGPSWYSVGRPTATEITGKRYNSINHLPLYIVELVNQQCPTFIESSAPFLNDFRSQTDLLDSYKPWYSSITKKIRNKKN